VVKRGVDEGVFACGCARMGNRARGFIYGEHVGVLKKDFERNIGRRRKNLRRRRQEDAERVAGVEFVLTGERAGSVGKQKNETIVKKTLDLGTTARGKETGKDFVGAVRSGTFRDRNNDGSGIGVHGKSG
jgi:hypothetical protein